jgi:hypothetical protein
MRRVLGRHRTGIAALVLAGLAAVLVLLALDVRTWQHTVARDDLRFRALPGHRGLWRPNTTLPGDPASLLLGTGDTMAYRRALQYFWFSRIGSDPDVRQDTPTIRAIAQQRMQNLVSSAPNRTQQSAAANLLGVLVVTTPLLGQDRAAISQILGQAEKYFQQAIALDSTNVDAKENLEIVLRLQKPGRGRFGKDARAGYGFGRGRGAGAQGGGY